MYVGGATIGPWRGSCSGGTSSEATCVRCTNCGTLGPGAQMGREPLLRVVFYAGDGGRESVRDWLRDLDRSDRLAIGTDLKTAQFGWPLGMPLIRKLEMGLWEVRSRVRHGVVRTVFTVEGNTMVVLHAFVKKSSKAPQSELDVARRRLARLRGRQR